MPSSDIGWSGDQTASPMFPVHSRHGDPKPRDTLPPRVAKPARGDARTGVPSTRDGGRSAMKAKGAGNHREANALVEFRPQGEIRASPLHGGLWGLGGPGRRVCEKFCKGPHLEVFGGGRSPSATGRLLLRWGCEAAMSHCVTTADGGPASSHEDDRRGPCLCWPCASKRPATRVTTYRVDFRGLGRGR